MTDIYLIRHTQSEGNLYRMMQGHWDGQITRQGAAEIELLAKRFENVHIDALYSSDLTRTMLTADAVSRHQGLEIIKDRRLREINVGPLEGEFFGNLEWLDPESSKMFMYDSEKWEYPGAETFNQVKKRAYAALEDIASRHDGQTIAVVSHGVTIRCLLSEINGVPLSDIQNCPICKNTAVSMLHYENGKFSCEYLNDYSHLGELGEYHWWGTADLRDEEHREGELTAFELFEKDKHTGHVTVDEKQGIMVCLEMEPEYEEKSFRVQAAGRAIKRLRNLGFDTKEIEAMCYE